MLKPTDVHDSPRYTEQDLLDLECQFDGAIRQAAEKGWPAYVRSVRDTIKPAAVSEIARRYRELGWDVKTNYDGFRAVINRPEPRDPRG